MREPVSRVVVVGRDSGGGDDDDVALGESSALERSCLDIASDDESLRYRECELECESGVSGQPVLMSFRGAFLGPALAASGFGRRWWARGRARDGRPASWCKWD